MMTTTDAPGLERRYIPATELRVSDADDETLIEGYAALFNSRSEDLGGFIEIIVPGAFRNALKVSDTRALWNHNDDYVLGRIGAGTLTIEEDAKGLRIRNRPPNTTWARDHLETIRRRDVHQMSFAFRLADNGAVWTKSGNLLLRTIHDIAEVSDVSPVTYPAYPATSVGVVTRPPTFSRWRKLLDMQTADKLADMRRDRPRPAA